MTVDRLLGKRYVTDFRVLALGATPESGNAEHPDRPVVLGFSSGDMYRISLGELRALIASSLIQEKP